MENHSLASVPRELKSLADNLLLRIEKSREVDENREYTFSSKQESMVRKSFEDLLYFNEVFMEEVRRRVAVILTQDSQQKSKMHSAEKSKEILNEQFSKWMDILFPRTRLRADDPASEYVPLGALQENIAKIFTEIFSKFASSSYKTDDLCNLADSVRVSGAVSDFLSSLDSFEVALNKFCQANKGIIYDIIFRDLERQISSYYHSFDETALNDIVTNVVFGIIERMKSNTQIPDNPALEQIINDIGCKFSNDVMDHLPPILAILTLVQEKLIPVLQAGNSVFSEQSDTATSDFYLTDEQRNYTELLRTTCDILFQELGFTETMEAFKFFVAHEDPYIMYGSIQSFLAKGIPENTPPVLKEIVDETFFGHIQKFPRRIQALPDLQDVTKNIFEPLLDVNDTKQCHANFIVSMVDKTRDHHRDPSDDTDISSLDKECRDGFKKFLEEEGALKPKYRTILLRARDAASLLLDGETDPRKLTEHILAGSSSHNLRCYISSQMRNILSELLIMYIAELQPSPKKGDEKENITAS